MHIGLIMILGFMVGGSIYVAIRQCIGKRKQVKYERARAKEDEKIYEYLRNKHIMTLK